MDMISTSKIMMSWQASLSSPRRCLENVGYLSQAFLARAGIPVKSWTAGNGGHRARKQMMFTVDVCVDAAATEDG